MGSRDWMEKATGKDKAKPAAKATGKMGRREQLTEKLMNKGKEKK